MPKLAGLALVPSKNYVKMLGTPIIEVLARKTLLALGGGGGALSRLKLAKNKIQALPRYPNTVQRMVYYGYTDPKPIYRVAHVYVRPARFDAFPVSVVEAITCGCAPVISRSAGAIDFSKSPITDNILPFTAASRRRPLLLDSLHDKVKITKYKA